MFHRYTHKIMITPELVEKYLSEKEAMLTQYMLQQAGNYNLRKASTYLQKLSDTLFGNEKHGGMINYLMTQPTAPKDIGEVLSMSERYFEKGWHVGLIDGRYWLMSGEFKRVADVTGKQDMFVPPASLSVEDASLFLSVSDGQLLRNSATKSNIAIPLLKSPSFTLEFINKEYPDNIKLLSLAKNYSSMGRLLSKIGTYPAANPENTVTIEEVLSLGYRLSEKMHPSDATVAYLSNGMSDIIIRRPSSNEGANVMATNQLVESLSEFVVPEKVVELEEMNQVYGIIFKKEAPFFDGYDYYDNELVLKGLMSQNHVPKEYLDKIENNLYTYLLARLLIFGDLHTNLNSFCLNSVNGMIYSRYTGSFFSIEPGLIKIVNNSIEKYQPSGNLLEAMSASDRETPAYLCNLIKTLASKADLNILREITVDAPSEHAEYIGIAKAILMRLK